MLNHYLFTFDVTFSMKKVLSCVLIGREKNHLKVLVHACAHEYFGEYLRIFLAFSIEYAPPTRE